MAKMIPVHVWANPDCFGVHDLPRRLRMLDMPASLRLNPYYVCQENDLEKFHNPLIHISYSRLNNRVLAQINKTILEEESGVHILILTRQDVRATKEEWLERALHQMCANARFRTKTRIILVNLVKHRVDNIVALKQVMEQAAKKSNEILTLVDAAPLMRNRELDLTGLTEAGERFLIESLVQALQDIPFHAFS